MYGSLVFVAVSVHTARSKRRETSENVSIIRRAVRRSRLRRIVMHVAMGRGVCSFAVQPVPAFFSNRRLYFTLVRL